MLTLSLARSLPLVWLVPALGGPTIGVPLRLAFGVFLAGLCLPILSDQLHAESALSLVVVAREMFVGGAMGLACACWFRAAEVAGRLTDTLSGYNTAGGALPTDGSKNGPFGGFMLLLAVVIFLQIGGMAHVTLALARSYDAIPVVAPVAMASTARAFAVATVVASAKLFEASLSLCAPVLVALLIADLVLGFIGRAVPQLPVFGLGFPVKALLTIGVFLVGLGGLRAAMQGSLVDFLTLMLSVTDVGR